MIIMLSMTSFVINIMSYIRVSEREKERKRKEKKGIQEMKNIIEFSIQG